MFDQHPHRPLSTSRSIRLLECKRRGRKSNGLEDLELRLVEASLDNLPPYFALSYVWGDTKATESIVCDGKKLWITRNCASALGRILPSTSTCTIWVDSICIDQSCIPERNAQVALMSEIFSCAEKVLVWLGEGDKDSRKAISYLKRLATIVELPSRRMMEFGLNATLEAMEVSAGSAVFGLYREYSQGIEHLFGRPWFYRVWTFQEVVLARKAEVICGADRIPWDQFSTAAYVLQRKDSSSGFSIYNGGIFSTMQQIRSLRESLGLESVPRPVSFAMPLRHPLNPTRGFVASDKRNNRFGPGAALYLTCTMLSNEEKDKVFGTYAIYQKLGVPLPQPDYAKGFRDLVLETSEALIQHEQCVELLYYASATKRALDLPSWVPDPSRISIGSFGWIPCHEYFNAAGSSVPSFTISADHKLGVRGIIVDTVKSRSIGWDRDKGSSKLYWWTTYEGFLQMFRPMISAMCDAIHLASEMSSKNGCANPLEQACEVLLQEIFLSYQDSPSSVESLRKLFANWASKFLEKGAQADGAKAQIELQARYPIVTPAGIESMNDYWALRRWHPCARRIFFAVSTKEAIQIRATREWRILTAIDSDDDSAMVHEVVAKRLANNCLVATESGRLGLANSQVQKGDQIALFSGFLLPMVVRRSGGEYRMLGPAYLEGAMLGEQWPSRQGALGNYTIS